MTQCECFWGERQLVAPRRQLLIPQHAPIGCQQMCLTRELILQSIENCHVYAYTNSLCTFLFVPRCRCLPLLPFDTACAICRESCKRSTVSHPLLCVPPLRQSFFVVNSPSLDTCTVMRFMHAFPLASGMLPSIGLLPLKPAFPCYP